MSERDAQGKPTDEELFAEAARAYNAGDIRQAELLTRRILSHNLNHSQAAHMLGVIGLQAGEADGGLQLLLHAVKVDPNNVDALVSLGLAYRNASHVDNAATAFRKILDVDPGHATAHYYLGTLEQRTGRTEQALGHYRQAVERDAGHADALANIAKIMEQRNELDEARRFAERAVASSGANFIANLTLAELDLRDAELDGAVARLQQLLTGELTPRNRALALSRLGKTYDRLGRYAEAFQAFDESNQVLLRLYVHALPEDDNVYSLASVNRLKRFFETADRSQWTRYEPPAGARRPIFLIGFPRSGTTLLDQILTSHQQLYVLEEQETLEDIYTKFAQSAEALEQLTDLSSSEIETYRQKYWQRIEHQLPEEARGKIIVDKLPLNTLLIGVINRFFPDARYVFAVRDPRDVCLSCFMQSFQLEGAMGYFLTLDNTALYYASVMDLGRYYIDQLPLDLHRIRYEDLVGDFEAETRGLLDFIGVGWDDNVTRFYETAKEREISTPSYAQVAQPLYASAISRWSHYEAQLAPILPRIASLIKHFGYG